MSIGKIAASGVAVTNENTLALANVNASFSLFTFQGVPVEFQPIGNALTTKRRNAAETGDMKFTATKLGYLFQGILPETPLLQAAYGKRVSEILKEPGVNPKGTAKDGPFREFIGADCTSIWAAANSGPWSISMLLLACLLARAWTDKEAISIWVEIVKERQRQIIKQAESGIQIHPLVLATAKREFRRYELAEWDNSARAWLARADSMRRGKLVQLRLIKENISLPYSHSDSTFDDVVEPWIQSMKMMEGLLERQPQKLSFGVGLVAISAWHIFPNIVVFQKKAQKVPFDDNLVPPSSVLSIGVKSNEASESIAQWSLSLSHLNYYGDPVPVQSGNGKQLRVRPDQLWIAVLGIVFGKWKVPYLSFREPLEWLYELHKVVKSIDEPPPSDHAEPVVSPWIRKLCHVASEVWQNQDPNDEYLIKIGYRKGRTFLGDNSFKPYFGLRDPLVVETARASSNVEPAVFYLRSVAARLGIESKKGLITATIHELIHGDTQLISVAPIDLGEGPMYTRWLSGTVESEDIAEVESLGECAVKIDDGPTLDFGLLRLHQPPQYFGETELDFRECQSTKGYTLWLLRKGNDIPFYDVNKDLLPLNEAMAFVRSHHLRDALAFCQRKLTVESEACESCLWLLDMADKTYNELGGGTVALNVIETKATIITDYFRPEMRRDDVWLSAPLEEIILESRTDLAVRFSVIAYMESGSLIVKPQKMPDVFAISFQDSIFVANIMLSDLHQDGPLNSQVTRIVGNVGRTGMVLLVSPENPRQRHPIDRLNSVRHLPYDNTIRDSFAGTSLHLSFTGWTQSIDSSTRGTCDDTLYLLESAVSVQHDGNWVADINVFDMYCRCDLYPVDKHCLGDCQQSDSEKRDTARDLVAIDSWDELLDYPPSGAVFRAHDNWIARLAAACIFFHRAEKINGEGIGDGRAVIISRGEEKLCMCCIEKAYRTTELFIID